MATFLRSIALAAASFVGASSFLATDAHACGGCFHQQNDPETTVVTGHRMAFSISPTQTVLWDQVSYTGSPAEFAWVLPIKKGAHLELATDAWFEALDAATSTVVVPPSVNCPVAAMDGEGYNSGCCGEMSMAGASGMPEEAPPPPPVTVVKRETIGPYDVVTLSTDVQGVLLDWLKQNGFAVDASIEPVIDQYTAEGFDFIALRLTPGKTVQSMKPVRVVSPGASPVLPLRMVAAGTGANTAVTLFIIGEGRWEAKNFPNVVVDAKDISWDFSANKSTYADVRAELLAQQNGRTWLTSFAREKALLSPLVNFQGTQVAYADNSATIAEFYVSNGVTNKETVDGACANQFGAWTNSMDLVVDPCDNGGSGGGGGGGGGGSCMLENGQIDQDDFACADAKGEKSFDDLAVALTGLHPASVWLTRIEANLSRAALENDLELQAATQSPVDNWILAGQSKNSSCFGAMAIPPSDATLRANRERRMRTDLAAVTLLLAGIGLAAGRRTHRIGHKISA